MSYIGSTPTTQSFISGTDTFSGTGSQTNFTLSRLVNTVNDIQVVVNNVVQYPPNYSISGNTLTISPAPSAGTNNVYVRYLSTTLQTFAPSQGTIGRVQLDIASLNGTGAAAMPTGTTAERPSSPVAGMQRFNTTTGYAEYYDGTAWWQFNQTRTYAADVLVVAGGGGGSSGASGAGGGGGAGGYRSFTAEPLAIGTSYTVTVGAGGTGGTFGAQGSNSVFSSYTATGGGGGGYNSAGGTGGSGGGSGNNGAGLSTFTGAAGNTPSTSPSQGNNGGANFPASNAWTGGGGGGASAVGGAGSSGVGGVGGAGTASSISGTSVTRAGGGGGGTWNAGTSGGTGGAGGGGNGGKGTSSVGVAGTANTGGGGGGGGQDSAGGAGGSGVVIISYAGAQRGTGGTVTSSGGNTIHTFTTSGTYTA